MAFRYTPTPTPSNTPTTSLTPSITPTITPSSTSCPYVCCLPQGFSGQCLIANMKLCDDDTILISANFLSSSYQGQSLAGVETIRIDACGNLLNRYNIPLGNVGNSGGFFQQTDGKIVVATNQFIWRLNNDFTIDTTFTSGRTPSGSSLGIGGNSDDEILLVGNFGTNYITSAGTITYNNNIYKLNKDGVPVPSYSGRSLTWTSPNIEPFDNQIKIDPDGKLMVEGFTAYSGDSNYQGIIRLNENFELDTTFRAAGFTGTIGRTVYTSYPLSDGKYLVGGQFVNYSGFSNQDTIIRLNNDGTLDTTFVNGLSPTSIVYDLELQSTGKIIVCDSAGTSVRRLNANGSNDPTWIQGVIGSISYRETSILMFPNDRMFIGGGFNTYDTLPYQSLVKLYEDGSLNMCPIPSLTPTPSITPTNTPSLTPTKTPNTTASPTPSITPSQTFVYYIYAGTTNLYATDTLACNNKTCGRPWYKSVPTWSIGTIVYDDSALTTPLVGGNNWIAVSTSTGTYCGGGWASVQVDNSGVILNFVSCP